FLLFFFFFFQAEDGIRDRNVTGVQTCALPISAVSIAGAGPVCATAFCSGIGDAGLDGTGTGTGLRAGADSNLAGEAGAGLGIAKIGRASCRERVEIAVGGGGVKKKRGRVYRV